MGTYIRLCAGVGEVKHEWIGVTRGLQRDREEEKCFDGEIEKKSSVMRGIWREREANYFDGEE
jgi:hypothetical protein